MNSYFFKLTKEDRESILDKHKTLYDGFATQYSQSKEQPLYVQDFANDKGGITVTNTGNVKSYTNMNINEMYYSGDAEVTPEESFDFGGPDEMYVSMGESLDMIGDGDDDLEHGTFDDEGTDRCHHCNGLGFDDFNDTECEWCGGSGFVNMFDEYEKEPDFKDIEDLEDDDIEIDIIEPLQEQVNKTLDMFRRFKKY